MYKQMKVHILIILVALATSFSATSDAFAHKERTEELEGVELEERVYLIIEGELFRSHPHRYEKITLDKLEKLAKCARTKKPRERRIAPLPEKEDHELFPSLKVKRIELKLWHGRLVDANHDCVYKDQIMYFKRYIKREQEKKRLHQVEIAAKKAKADSDSECFSEFESVKVRMRRVGKIGSKPEKTDQKGVSWCSFIKSFFEREEWHGTRPRKMSKEYRKVLGEEFTNQWLDSLSDPDSFYHSLFEQEVLKSQSRKKKKKVLKEVPIIYRKSGELRLEGQEGFSICNCIKSFFSIKLCCD